MSAESDMLRALFECDEGWWEYDANWCQVCGADINPEWQVRPRPFDHSRHEPGCPVPAMIEWWERTKAGAR